LILNFFFIPLQSILIHNKIITQNELQLLGIAFYISLLILIIFKSSRLRLLFYVNLIFTIIFIFFNPNIGNINLYIRFYFIMSVIIVVSIYLLINRKLIFETYIILLLVFEYILFLLSIFIKKTNLTEFYVDNLAKLFFYFLNVYLILLFLLFIIHVLRINKWKIKQLTRNIW
jgi:hypothetical protein